MSMIAYFLLLSSLVVAGATGFDACRKEKKGIVCALGILATLLMLLGYIFNNENQLGKIARESKLRSNINEIYEVINAVPYGEQHFAILLSRDGTIKTYTMEAPPPSKIFKVYQNGEYKPYPSSP